MDLRLTTLLLDEKAILTKPKIKKLILLQI